MIAVEQWDDFSILPTHRLFLFCVLFVSLSFIIYLFKQSQY